MYNPELALQRERDLLDDERRLSQVAKRLGNDHPWTKRVLLVTDILEKLSQKEGDLDSCFDLDTRSRIEDEISELILIARETLSN